MGTAFNIMKANPTQYNGNTECVYCGEPQRSCIFGSYTKDGIQSTGSTAAVL